MKRNLTFYFIVLAVMPFCSAKADLTLLDSVVNGSQTVTDTWVNNTPSGTAVTLPVTGLVTGALGAANFMLSADGNSLAYTLSVPVLPATAIFMAHIHLGPKGANGPVIFWLYGNPSIAPSNSPVPSSAFPRNDGTFTGQISGVLTAANFVAAPTYGLNTPVQAVQNILAGNAYVNVHTIQYPLGEIRGQMNVVK